MPAVRSRAHAPSGNLTRRRDWRWWVRPYFRWWLRYYFTSIRSTDWYSSAPEGPLLLASNHPNAFLDGILLAVLFPRALHILARGDAFGRPWISRLLHSLGVLPIYRLSEGKQWLPQNQQSFDACIRLFEAHGSVLVFAEGSSEHCHTLRPLKKGTARLAWQSWHSDSAEAARRMKVIPLGLRYESFGKSGSRVAIGSASWLGSRCMDGGDTEGACIRLFNRHLEQSLQEALDVAERLIGTGQAALTDDHSHRAWMRVLGELANGILLPFTAAIRYLSILTTRQDPVFRSSVELSALVLGFPCWLLAVLGIGHLLGWSWGLTLGILALFLLCLPLSGWRHEPLPKG